MNYNKCGNPYIAWASLNAVTLVIGHALTRGLEALLMNLMQRALTPKR